MNWGYVVLMFICFICAALFLGIGIWAKNKKTPMHFWADSKIPVEKVTDVRAYNRENGNMWSIYSIQYWICSILAVFGVFSANTWIPVVILMIMMLSSTVGIWWLIRTYSHIAKRYCLNAENA